MELLTREDDWIARAGTDRTRMRMRKELFGLFGDRSAFERHRETDAFDTVVAGEYLTVGLRDPALGVSGRSDVYEHDAGHCVVWGEAFCPTGGDDVAAWLADAYAERGEAAFADLNGSYLVALEHGEEALVATDPIRSWECFYTDAPGTRVFGSDPTPVQETVPDPEVRRTALLEFLHLGTVLGEKTLFERTRRAPFDGYVTRDGHGEFRRFVYDPAEFDYAAELADRLRTAIDRRSDYPGETGLLLSAGYDSRVLLSELPAVSRCYTVGSPNDQEVAAARRVADQYGADHRVLETDDRYLSLDPSKSRYSQSIKESLHVHHAGYTDDIEVDSVYHGLLYDTLFKGFFLERDAVEIAGKRLPWRRLAADPDPFDSLLDTLGFSAPDSRDLTRSATRVFEDVEVDDPAAFLRSSLESELDACRDRAASAHNATDLLAIRNQPVLPFRTHLADNFLESFVAVDSGLLEWHLRTPPEHRSPDTFREAMERLDPAIDRHNPPDRPHDAPLLNYAESFLRRLLPFLSPFESAWPDREAVYERYDVAARLSAPVPEDLSVRHALRLHDALTQAAAHECREH
ncbi:asparagine synthase-related protein [Halosimplex amylolyticum]|uniref:asparagine synthase-related protein n=1 Tax=Halosimplex amylolyticum TaxID=3396616 RepID=UPI003F577BC3